jgi:hypothetical protein
MPRTKLRVPSIGSMMSRGAPSEPAVAPYSSPSRLSSGWCFRMSSRAEKSQRDFVGAVRDALQQGQPGWWGHGAEIYSLPRGRRALIH